LSCLPTMRALASSIGSLLAISACRTGTTNSTKTACDHVFDVLYVQCAQATPPADEIARQRQRYEQVCERGLALPGIAVTPEQLSACATQVAADGCRISGALAACLRPGTLGGDASCVDSLQCQSNSCSKPFLFNPDSGTSTMLACGSCEALIPVGQPCGSSVQGLCAPGAQCVSGARASGTCVAAGGGEIGEPCGSAPIGSSTSSCNPGLFCDSYGMCAVPEDAGAQCFESIQCAYPLSCIVADPSRPGASSTCQSPHPAGALCQQDSDCAKGLACDSTTGRCAPLTWTGSGQPCSETAHCLVGNCPTGSAGSKCPVVIPDGQPCRAQNSPAMTCDAFASCVDGVCSMAHGVACP
jgi:hypothetical protein